ncbi:MAG: SRPBCC domain-containing protein [Alphaproteobacteria bacterium]|nr:SRPBCC domain-containing protein [Alphaproteobacteria bacterium]
MSILKIERHFPVTPARLFSFVTKKENLLKWWGPEGTRIGEHDLDLSEPGEWWFVMIAPDGGRHKVSGKIVAVDPPNFVEFTLVVHAKNGPPSIDSVVRFEVHPDQLGGSRLVLTQTGLTSDEIVTGSTQGWVSTLGRLERLLGASPKNQN